MPNRKSPTRLRCPACGATVRASHHFCPSCGWPLGAAPAPAPPWSPPRAGASLQVVTEHPDQLEEERRMVTVLFADLSGSTSLAEGRDPEEVRDILSRYFAALARQVQRYGGTIDKYIGDAVMAVFGAPVAHEDDAQRALRAALDMQAEIARENQVLDLTYGVRLALRIGVNTGEVVAGRLPGEVQAAYTVTGDAVNTAQRLESAAPPGQVLAGALTQRLARDDFHFEAVEPLVLKGKSEPVPAFRVVTLREEQPAEEGILVGRRAELELLEEALAQAIDGRGQVLAVRAEAGLGKSRLLLTLHSGLPASVRWFAAGCASFEQQVPYGFAGALLRALVGIHRADPEATAAELLRQTLGEQGIDLDVQAQQLLLEVIGYGQAEFDPEARRRILLSVLRRLLAALAARSPCVVAAEDLHWVDASSASLLDELVTDIPGLPCLLIGTGRDDWRPRWPGETLDLRPLLAAEARTLIESCLGASAEEELAQAILEKAGGNPFFVVEVAQSLVEERAVELEGGVWRRRRGLDLRVPPSVQEVLAARIDRLAPSSRRVTTRASVIGRDFWYRLLERLVPAPSLKADLHLLLAAQFIEPLLGAPEPGYSFRHALIQEVAYSKLLLSQRRRLHAAVGDAIVALYTDRLEEFLDALAYHYSRSSDHDQARRYLLLAGRRAQRLYANQEAAAYFESVLKLPGEDAAATATALEGLGDVARFQGAYREASGRYQEALAALTGGREGSSLLRKVGLVRQLLGQTDLALEAFDSALTALEGEAGEERARVLTDIGHVRWQQGQYELAAEVLEQAVEVAERAGAGEARAEAYKHLGTTHLLRGDPELALQFYNRSLLLYETSGDPFGHANVLNNIGILHRRLGRYQDAVEVHERALRLRERIGDPHGIGMSRNNLAQIHRARGDLETAARDYAVAMELWSSIGYAYGIALARTGLGIVAVERGEGELGKQLLLEALREWEVLGSRSYLSEVQRYIAQAHLPKEPAAALAWAEQAVATARELAAKDQEALAVQVHGQTLVAAGRLEEAIAALERSRQLLTGGLERQELGRTLAELGKAYRSLPADDKRRAQAQDLLAEAHSIFAQIGAAEDLRRLEETAASV